MRHEAYKPSDELLRLASGLMDEELDRTAHAQLQQLLKEDEQARQWYADLMLVHSLLALDGRHGTLELPPPVIDFCCQTVEDDEELLVERQLSVPSLGTTNRRSTAFGRPAFVSRFCGRGPTQWGILLATVASVFIVAAIVYQLVRRPQAAFPFRGADVVVVKHEVGAKFVYGADEERRPKPGSVLKRGKYELIDGLIELEYESGATLVIMAPADFTLIDEMNVKLDEGKISAHIPDAAIGFTIDSVGGQVVDLGTAFAVDARRGKEAEVHVFEGEVRVELHHENDQPSEPVSLLAGRATRMSAGSPIASGIDLNSRKFVRSLSVEPDAYANAHRIESRRLLSDGTIRKR